MLTQTSVYVSKPPNNVIFKNFKATSLIEWVCAPFFLIVLIRSKEKQTDFNLQKRGEMAHFTKKIILYPLIRGKSQT